MAVAVIALTAACLPNQPSTQRLARGECLNLASSAVLVGTLRSDSTGRPISGAQVIVLGTRCGSLTDNLGRYTVLGISPGRSSVRAEFIGFAGETRELLFGAKDTVHADFNLKPSRVIIGCDRQVVETAPDPIPPGPISQEQALGFTGLPIEGWGCVLKSVRRRVALDSATVAFFADLLAGVRSTDHDPYRPTLLYWLAVSRDPQYVPVFLDYSSLDRTPVSRDDRVMFTTAMEGLIRHASQNADALERLVSLADEGLETIVERYLFRGLARVNNPQTRHVLSRILEQGELRDYQASLVEDVLETEPCPPGTLMGWGHQIEQCSVPDP